MFRIVKFIICIFLLQFSSVAFSQQKEPADSLVRLIEAQSAKLENINGISYRRIVGPARFLHNNTYLLCDTAIWNVDTNIIDAVGNVQIIQENTFLKSDKIEYVVNENTAKFRGNLVELFDREGNILKTNFLDYNTKDSIAVFYGGAALKSSDGNIIESDSGRYESSFKLFTFTDNVNMFTDSVFIKSDKIQYNTDINTAYFGEGTTAWKDDNIFCANDGELDRPQKIFTFKKDSYILTRDQEVWADTLKYYNSSGEAELRRNVQLLDTTKTSFCLADEVLYYPKPMKVELRKNPVVGLYSYEEGVADTLFFIADTINYYKKRFCDVDSSEVEVAKERLKLSKLDPIADVELKSLIARGLVKDPNSKKENNATENKGLQGLNSLSKNVVKGELGTADTSIDTLVVSVDSLNINKVDSLSNADSLSLIKNNIDTTEITFIDALKNVKFYRSNLQGLCDTLLYTSLDSIARLYSKPILWYDEKNQFSADSIQAVITEGRLNKINLLSNALILSQEQDTSFYNQIKSTEMTAFFKGNELYRFDALGGASAIVFMAEDSLISLMNQKNSKMLTASIKDRVIQRVKYIEEIKEDVYPVYNLTPDKKN
jgi:Organic solvent tolerance protein OstA